VKAEHYNRLQALRFANDAARFAMEEQKPRFDRMAGRHENGTAPKAISAFNLFQTPVALAVRMVELLDLKPGARILEPSAGLGRLIDAAQVVKPSEVVAVEIAAACAEQLYGKGNCTIKQRDFLAVKPSDIGLFDAVLMNPPFHMRSDIAHIKHALSFLKPGCSLVAICMQGHRRIEELKPLASEWIDLEPDTFKETGTKTLATMLLIIK
jgi:predicted RNA methylase